MPSNRRRHIAVVALLGLLAVSPACTGRASGGAQPGPPPANPAASAPAPPPSAAAATSPAVAAAPPDPAHCFLGTYGVTSIEGRQGVDTPFGAARPAGDGGSLVLDLRADNTWTLSSDGSEPAKFQVGPYTVDARIVGTLRGSYHRVADAFQFKEEDANGTVTLSTPLGTREMDIDKVGSALAPTGTATMTCRADGLDFTSESVNMTLLRR